MIPFKFTGELKEHQKKAIQFTLKNPNSIICIETGGGKTACTLGQAMLFLAQGKVDKIIQVVTKKSKHSFKGDMEKLTTLKEEQIQYISSENDLCDIAIDNNKIIGVIQYEYIKMIPIENWIKFFKSKRVLVQLDEYHRCKSPLTELFIPQGSNGVVLSEKMTTHLTQLSNVLYSIRPFITYLTGYTATPLTKNLDDLFWLCSLAKPGIFQDSLLYFYNKYIAYSVALIPIKKGSLRKRTMINKYGYKNTEELISVLSTICFNYFPPKKINFIKKYYDSLEIMSDYKKAVRGILDTYNERKLNEETGEKEDKEFSARLLDAQYVLNNSRAKQDCLLEVLKETIDKGVLIYCSYYNTVDIVKNILIKHHIPYKEISGRTSDTQCKNSMDWFNGNPKGKAVILTEAGAQSINLQSTDSIIYYDIPTIPKTFIQSFGRISRIGSKYSEFNCYIIMSEGTVDEYRYEYLGSNHETIQFIQGNPNFLPSGELKSFNTTLLKRLRDKFLWNK